MLAQSDIDRVTDVLGASTLRGYVIAAIIIVAAVVIGRVARMAINRIVNPSRVDNFVGLFVGRLVNYLVLVFGLIYALETLGIAIGPILGALGIAGIALAFAFQNILENFVAGIILQLQRPFNSGDEVLTAGYEGVVTAVDARTITMETQDGEIVRIPSAEVIKQPIVNHTENGRRRSTVTVGIAYGTNLQRARTVALDAVGNVDTVLTRPEPEVLFERFGDSSIDLAVRFWHEPSIGDEWLARSDVGCALVEAFEAGAIEIPFPQRVLHYPA